MAAYNSFIRRLWTIPHKGNDCNGELNTMKYVTVSRGYNNSVNNKILRKHNNNKFKPRSNIKAKKCSNYINVTQHIFSTTVLDTIGFIT